ncbi:MAG TPA: DsrE family protein [Methylococcaceae bacterium]|nr:DsrE family protein [Methylococcaceae bacterium]
MDGRRFLCVFRRAPHTDAVLREHLDLTLTLAAFEQAVELLFLDDGVYALLPDRQSLPEGPPSPAQLLAALPFYGLEQPPLVERESLLERGLDGEKLLPARHIGRHEVAALLGDADVVLSL